MRTAPRATPHHSSAGAPRVDSTAPSASRRTTARARIASRNGAESLENQEPDSMFDCSSIVRTGGCMAGRSGDRATRVGDSGKARRALLDERLHPFAAVGAEEILEQVVALGGELLDQRSPRCLGDEILDARDGAR